MEQVHGIGIADLTDMEILSGDYVQCTPDGEFHGQVGVVVLYRIHDQPGHFKAGIDWNMFGNDYKPEWDKIVKVGSETEGGYEVFPNPKSTEELEEIIKNGVLDEPCSCGVHTLI